MVGDAHEGAKTTPWSFQETNAIARLMGYEATSTHKLRMLWFPMKSWKAEKKL